MTRQEIEQEYKILNNKIVSPGKFEGEMYYVPHYWGNALDGFADESHNNGEQEIAIFHLNAGDVENFPELEGIQVLEVWEDRQGFVHSLLV